VKKVQGYYKKRGFFLFLKRCFLELDISMHDYLYIEQ
jgi:hypothetical protein